MKLDFAVTNCGLQARVAESRYDQFVIHAVNLTQQCPWPFQVTEYLHDDQTRTHASDYIPTLLLLKFGIVDVFEMKSQFTIYEQICAYYKVTSDARPHKTWCALILTENIWPHSARQGYQISYLKGFDAISVPPSFLHSDLWIIPTFVYTSVTYNYIWFT